MRTIRKELADAKARIVTLDARTWNSEAATQLQTALNARTVEVTQVVSERHWVDQINRDLNQRIVVLEQANCPHKAIYEDIRGMLRRETAVHVGAVRRYMEAKGFNVEHALESASGTFERFVEMIEHMNVAERSAARFGDPTFDTDS